MPVQIKTSAMKRIPNFFLWAIGTAGLTVIFFLPVLRGEFLNWDDQALFVENFCYRRFDQSHWQWMCATFYLGHWQPLSWLSCALDYKIWGMNPSGWHATNLLLHTMNAMLVYLLCLIGTRLAKGCDRAQTSSEYIPAVLAALFWAVHPLRVEAAAWLATRGYLLCTTFCLLTVLFYLREASLPEKQKYPLAALLCFTLATFTKGIGMMLPSVLLLLDWFLLRRITSIRAAFRCAAAKIPFFALFLLAGITAFLAKKWNGGMASVENYGLIDRLSQAVYGIWFYLLKTVSPQNLSPLYYKRPEAWQVLTALTLTAAAAIFLFLFRRKLRTVIAAAGAFLLLILPMLGFTQSGSQLFADRFTYLAAVPFSILLAVTLARINKLKIQIYGSLTILLLLFGVQTFIFSNTWNNGLKLWSRAVSLDCNNARAHNNLGLVLMDGDYHDEALECFERAIQIDSKDAMFRHNRALALTKLKRYEEALAEWKTAFFLPGSSKQELGKMTLARGWVFEQTGNREAAEKDYAYVADDPDMDAARRSRALQLQAALFIQDGCEEKAEANLHEILKLPDTVGSCQEKARLVLKGLKKIPRE